MKENLTPSEVSRQETVNSHTKSLYTGLVELSRMLMLKFQLKLEKDFLLLKLHLLMGQLSIFIDTNINTKTNLIIKKSIQDFLATQDLVSNFN